MKSRLGNIGHTAHFGGAIGGYVTTLIFFPKSFANRSFDGRFVGASYRCFVCITKSRKN